MEGHDSCIIGLKASGMRARRIADRGGKEVMRLQ